MACLTTAAPGSSSSLIFHHATQAPLSPSSPSLAKHNERPWFQERKATYDQLRAQFEEDAEFWAASCPARPGAGRARGRKSIFRIYRDVRFSKNKDPYKTHFSAYFTASPGKEVDSPGYYLQLGPNGNTLIAGGLTNPTKASWPPSGRKLTTTPAS